MFRIANASTDSGSLTLIHSSLMSSLLTTIFCAPDQPTLPQLVASAPAQWQQTQVLKKDKGTTVTLIKTETSAIVIKHHCLLTWRHKVEAALRGSPAWRAWNGAQLLQMHGFRIPRPLGVFEKRTTEIGRAS